MSASRILDKFYTKPDVAEDCFDSISHYPLRFVELTAGNGAFSSLTDCDAYDLAPEADDIEQQDAFDWNPSEPSIVFGNPPFGRASTLAIRMFNHIAQFDNTKAIAWIIPRAWRRYTIQHQLNPDWDLMIDNDVRRDAFTLDGKDYSVGCCWQVWSRNVTGRRLRVKPASTHPDIKFNDSDYNWKIVSRGAKAGDWIPRDSDRIKWDNNTIRVTIDKPFPITTDLDHYATGVKCLNAGDVVKSYTSQETG